MSATPKLQRPTVASTVDSASRKPVAKRTAASSPSQRSHTAPAKTSSVGGSGSRTSGTRGSPATADAFGSVRTHDMRAGATNTKPDGGPHAKQAVKRGNPRATASITPGEDCISQLPDELLLDVFRLVVTNPTGSARDSLRLLRVCTRWRALALDVTLWRREVTLQEAVVLACACRSYEHLRLRVHTWPRKQLLFLQGSEDRFDASLLGRVAESIVLGDEDLITLRRVLTWSAGEALKTLTMTVATPDLEFDRLLAETLPKLTSLERLAIHMQGRTANATLYTILQLNILTLTGLKMTTSWAGKDQAPPLLPIAIHLKDLTVEGSYPRGFFSAKLFPALENFYLQGARNGWTDANIFDGDPPPLLRQTFLTSVLPSCSYENLLELSVFSLPRMPEVALFLQLVARVPRLRVLNVAPNSITIPNAFDWCLPLIHQLTTLRLLQVWLFPNMDSFDQRICMSQFTPLHYADDYTVIYDVSHEGMRVAVVLSPRQYCAVRLEAVERRPRGYVSAAHRALLKEPGALPVGEPIDGDVSLGGADEMRDLE